MRIIKSEFANNYKTYTFSFSEYAVMEKQNDLKDIYESGYLPYSGSSELKNYFYLCRSIRVNMEKFRLNSENKRILKKHEQTTQSVKKQIYKNYNQLEKNKQKELFDFYFQYFKNTHGEHIMSKERLGFILSSDFLNRIVVYIKDSMIVGSILMVDDTKNENRHFWFSAFLPDLKNTGFGLWLFLDQLQSASEKSLKYFYLGTGYGEKAKYKFQFEGLEYFDGNSWKNDIKKLKEKAKNDSIKKEIDDLKKDTSLF